MDLSWMYWSWQSALGFGMLATLLVGLSILDRFDPGYERKGFLPFRTTRGDRVFISIAWFLFLVFAWLKFFPDKLAAWVIVAISAVIAMIVVKWG
jgi:predicted small integral membrane protein